MDPRGADRPGPDDGYRIAVALSAHQIKALVLMIAESPTRDAGLDDLAWELTGSEAANPDGADAAVLAAAKGVVWGANVDMAAEREAADVAVAVASTEESVEKAAWTTAAAASQARDLNADAAAHAALQVAETAARTAVDVRVHAQALADQVAAAAERAAKVVAATTALGGDTEAALVALQLRLGWMRRPRPPRRQRPWPRLMSR